MVYWLLNPWGETYTASQLVIFQLTILLQVILPGVLRGLSGKIKHGFLGHIPNVAFRFWVFLEVCFAIQVVLLFAATWMAFIFSIHVLATNIITPAALYQSLDEPLTSRLLLAWTILFSFPYMVFRAVGLTSLRDVHQLAKEQHDRNTARREQGRSLRS